MAEMQTIMQTIPKAVIKAARAGVGTMTESAGPAKSITRRDTAGSGPKADGPQLRKPAFYWSA